MKRLLLTCLACLFALGSLWAQAETAPELLNLDEVLQKIGYPMEARSAHVSGKVVAKVKVNEAGKVESHEILESPSPVLSEAVSAHVHALKFKPARQNGVAIKSIVQVPFRFELPESTSFNKLEDALAATGEVETLDLSGQKLTALDSRVMRLTSLRHLNLDDNQLTSLPGSISKLGLLEELHLANNQLTSVPSSLKKLKHLKYIDLRGNKLSPAAIDKARTMFEEAEVLTD